MKIKLSLFFFLLVVSLQTFGQESETLLYNKKGELKADTTLSISKEQLNKWRAIEDLLIAKLVEVKYSAVAEENNLSGNSIIEFEIDSSGQILNFKIKNAVGGGLEELVKQSIKSFTLINSLKSQDGKVYKYYVPISFNLINAKEFIKKENSIPIFDVKQDYIQKINPY